MATTKSDYLINKDLWRFVGLGSSIVGFSCYAFSSSFKNLFGEWNSLKIFIYMVVSLTFSCFILFASKWKLEESSKITSALFTRAIASFLVLMVTCVYSFYQDKKRGNPETGHGRILSLISFGAFSLASLSLSIQIELNFELGMFNFFLECLIVSMMKMNIKAALVAAAFCSVLICIRSYSDYRYRSNSDSRIRSNGSRMENKHHPHHTTIDIPGKSDVPQQVGPSLDTGDGAADSNSAFEDSKIVELSSAIGDGAASSNSVAGFERPIYPSSGSTRNQLRHRFPSTRNTQVFVSFGSDIRHVFVSHVLAALRMRNIEPFFVEEADKGSPLCGRMIQTSKVSIVIFSKCYANSRGCLDELGLILDCHKLYGLKVTSIFYDVEFSEVKVQKGSYTDAFALHEKQFSMDQVQKWRHDLIEATDIANTRWKPDKTNSYGEHEIIEKCTEEVLSLLNSGNTNVLADTDEQKDL